MTDTAAIPQDVRERVESIGSADLVMGFVSPPRDQQSVDHSIESSGNAVAAFASPPRTVLVHPGYSGTTLSAATDSDGGSIQVIATPNSVVDSMTQVQGFAESFRSISNVARSLGARACGIITSDAAAVTSDWILNMAGPVLEANFDLVAPCYARHRFEGLINWAILYPLMRALYGRRVRNPFGPDFCLSARMVDRVPPASGSGSRIHPAAWVLPEAVSNGFKICQSHLGVRTYPTPDDTGVNVLLAQILSSLFGEIERRAALIQRVRGSQAVDEYGVPMYLPEDQASPDPTRLIESFQIGTRNLQEIWSVVLPPSTLVELKRLSRAAPSNFRMDDELWARVVYDFALAYRLRTINRDHLLRAITPLYFGWIASYAMDPENSSAEGADRVVERLCIAYENARPYFVARWRWPDRFNP